MAATRPADIPGPWIPTVRILHGTDSTLYLGTTSGELGGIPLDTWPVDWDPLRIMVG